MIAWQGHESIAAFWLSGKQKYAIVCEDTVSSNTVSKIFNRDDVEVVSGSGWKFVVGIVDELKALCATKNKKMFGFIDRDYWFVRDDENILTNSDLVHTSYRDIEIELIESSALLDFINIKKPTRSGHTETIRQSIYDNLYEIGMLRAYNHLNAKGWSFPEVIEYAGNGNFAFSRWESTFLQRNKIKKPAYTDYKEWKKINIFDPKNVIRGHDATMLLHGILGIQYAKPRTKNDKTVTIEDCLALCIRKEHLNHFNWAQSLRQLLV